MEAKDEVDGTFVVRHGSTRGFRWWLSAAAVVAIVALVESLRGRLRSSPASGWLLAAAVVVALGLAAFESGLFVFDRRQRVVRWKRQRAWRRLEGTLPFDDVADVAVESPIGDSGLPSRRITLRMKSGRRLPLRAGYVTDGDDELVRIAEQIRVAMGQPGQRTPDASAAALVAQGRTIDAIKELRQARGLSLTDAKREVDAMRADGS